MGHASPAHGRGLLTDGHGIPVGLVVAGANVNDHRLRVRWEKTAPRYAAFLHLASATLTLPQQGYSDGTQSLSE